MSEFRIPALEELCQQQVRFAPPARREEQLKRAKTLLEEIALSKKYPYPFVCYRITEFRPDAYPNLLISGEDLRNDLNLFIDRLSRTLQAAPAAPAEPTLSLDEVCKRFNVSSKTIVRWRKHGLIGQRIVYNGRKQLRFPQSLVERFQVTHADRVARGSRFSHLTEAEKTEIVRRARRLAGVGGSLTEVSRRIAHHLGRSPEAVRYTIKNFDRDHPEQAVFPRHTGPLSADVKLNIYTSYRRGIPVHTLAKRFHRTRTSIHRVVNEVECDKLLTQPIDYIDNPCFDDPTQADAILAPMPHVEEFTRKMSELRPPKDVPPELLALYQSPLLTREQEAHLFRQMNYLKHRMKKLRETMVAGRVKAADFDEFKSLKERAESIKEMLIKCNMRLVASIAKKHSNPTENLFELISDGNMSLIRAVEKFDYSRGNKFSTYASWAIMKNFARSIPDEKKHREHYMTGHEEVFDAAADLRSDEHEQITQAEQAARKVNELLDLLDPREREILRMRAGLDGSEPKTLEEVGKVMGITKERVRQLNVRIMKKLRDIVQERKMDI